jgi:membrane protein DedA with SNARE-associated domain
METAFPWIYHYDYLAIIVLLMLGSVGLPIPDEPLLVCVGICVSRATCRRPLLTALCKEAQQCLNV